MTEYAVDDIEITLGEIKLVGMPYEPISEDFSDPVDEVEP